jgi:phosphatidylethanolamine/phosphatidyl-N-methylethanolamine N-methyltransferase
MTAPAHALADGRTKASDYIRFLRAWVQRPRQTASIVPSSPHLGRMMASQIDPEGGPVMELGGGTGALTRQILATGLPRDQLEVVEINGHFARELRIAFPGVHILETPAEMVSEYAAGGTGGYQAIISGLPLLAMSASQQHAILAEAFRLLAPGGALIQFTYSPRSPFRREVVEALDLSVAKVGSILRNVPPATVFRIARNGVED